MSRNTLLSLVFIYDWEDKVMSAYRICPTTCTEGVLILAEVLVD